MRQQKISHHNEAGFTLIEVLIALAIFTIGILSVNAMQIAAIRGNYVANGLTEASVLVSDKIENIMAMPYDDAALVSTKDVEPHSTIVDGFTLTWDVVDDVPIDDCKTVTVNATGRQRNVTFAFVKSDYEP
jgi:prepilin-type N-terminal cleavage/methylation domain-containing protein